MHSLFHPVNKQRFIKVRKKIIYKEQCKSFAILSCYWSQNNCFVFGKTNQGILTVKVWRKADNGKYFNPEYLPIKNWKSHNTNFKLFWNIINKNVEFWLVSLCDWKPSRLVLGAPNEPFCKIAVLQWVLRWENWSSFMSCFKDEIHLLGDLFKQFLWNRHYRRQVANILSELSTINKTFGCPWQKRT